MREPSIVSRLFFAKKSAINTIYLQQTERSLYLTNLVIELGLELLGLIVFKNRCLSISSWPIFNTNALVKCGRLLAVRKK